MIPWQKKLPENTSLVISDGVRQLLLDSNERRFKKQFPEFLKGRLRTLSEALLQFGVPILPLHTDEDVTVQVRQVLGYVPGKQVKAGKITVRGAR